MTLNLSLYLNGGVLEAEQLCFSPKLPAAIGDALLWGDYLFGTANEGLMCVAFATGEIKWSHRAVRAASLCLADDRLYAHGENGEIALIEPSAEGYLERDRFSPPNQPQRSQPMEKAWAYPVVSHGRLFVRDQQMLWYYDLRASGQ